jgi:hypothetical protein
MPTYPPAPPTVDGNVISVSRFLKDPALVQRAIASMTRQRFIADNIFAAGPAAPGGAVMYERILDAEEGLYTDRDVTAIEPGDEFPIVNSGEAEPDVATTTKWGGAAVITYEARDRDKRDVLNRELMRLRNTIIRKVDTVGVAALVASVTAGDTPTMAASGSWSTISTDIIADIETGRSEVEESDLGYVVDTAIITPREALALRKNTGIRAALPRENMGANLIGAPDLSGLLRIPNWYVTNRGTNGHVWLLASKQVGSISDEKPLYSRIVDQPERERVLIMAARQTVPYITDPLAAIRITGA